MQWVDWLPWALYRSAKWQHVVGFRDKQGQDVWALVCGCGWVEGHRHDNVPWLEQAIGLLEEGDSATDTCPVAPGLGITSPAHLTWGGGWGKAPPGCGS